MDGTGRVGYLVRRGSVGLDGGGVRGELAGRVEGGDVVGRECGFRGCGRFLPVPGFGFGSSVGLCAGLSGNRFSDVLGDLLHYRLNYGFGFEDRGALAELALADGVYAVGCGSFGGLVFGGRRRDAEVGAIFGAMGCLRLPTSGLGAAGFRTAAGEGFAGED
jgi:hypothetical protein